MESLHIPPKQELWLHEKVTFTEQRYEWDLQQINDIL